MFKKKKKEESSQIQMCDESASLWTKCHNLPYLLSHRSTLVIYMVGGFIFDILKFGLIVLVWLFVQAEIKMLLEVLF